MCNAEEGYRQVPSGGSNTESIESETEPQKSCTAQICSRQFLKALLFGQFISLLLCGTAVSTGLLQKEGVNIPTAQSFFNYVLLCLVYGTCLACRKSGRSLLQCLKQWWWRYLLIAFVDVEANYLVVKAYSYTTVTSVQLLDCSSVITVFVLSYIFLRAGYKLFHLGGAGVCLLGMLGLVLTDVLVGKNSNEASNVALGDVLIIVGASLYGVSNVCEEYVVRHFDKIEFLGMVGLFGSMINGAQLAILERNEIGSLALTSKTVIALVVFVICLFLLYSLMTVVIQMTSATIVNLSILSADFYTLLAGLFLFNYKILKKESVKKICRPHVFQRFHFLYFVSFGVILTGLAVYSIKPVTTRHTNDTDLGTDEEVERVHTDQVNFKSTHDRQPEVVDIKVIDDFETTDARTVESPKRNIVSVNDDSQCSEALPECSKGVTAGVVVKI